MNQSNVLDPSRHLSYLAYVEDCLKKGIAPEPEIPYKIPESKSLVIGENGNLMGVDLDKVEALIKNKGWKDDDHRVVLLRKLMKRGAVIVKDLYGGNNQPIDVNGLKELCSRTRKEIRHIGLTIKTERTEPFRRSLASNVQ